MRGDAVKLWEEKANLLTDFITRLFVEQTLASPRFAKLLDNIFRYNPLKGCISRNRILTYSLGGSKPGIRIMGGRIEGMG